MMAAGTMVVRTEVTAIMDLLPLMSLGAGGAVWWLFSIAHLNGHHVA